jgi:hypothetical protein
MEALVKQSHKTRNRVWQKPTYTAKEKKTAAW